MVSAAFQHIGLGAALLLTALLMRAAETPARTAPSRPAASAGGAGLPSPAKATGESLPAKKFSGVDYVNLTDVATRLGLKFAWVKRGKVASLSGSAVRAEIEAD